jgi:hypothetical protein
LGGGGGSYNSGTDPVNINNGYQYRRRAVLGSYGGSDGTVLITKL